MIPKSWQISTITAPSGLRRNRVAIFCDVGSAQTPGAAQGLARCTRGQGALGFGLSVLIARDTAEHVRHEIFAHGHRAAEALNFWDVCRSSSLGDRQFCRLPGALAEQLQERHVLGLFALFFFAYGLDVEWVGV
jgi:hypothetical protein